MKKAKLIRQDIWSLTQQKKSDATPCYNQLAIYEASDATMTAMYRRGHLASVI
jgi:hypothetical protein